MKLTETTRRQKAEQRFLNGTFVKTIGIISPENPMGKKVESEENSKYINRFKDYMKNTNTKYFPVKGKYGNVEQSYMLFNITLEDLKLWASAFKQQSFIYGIVNDGKIHFQYYQMNNKNIYALYDEVDGFIERNEFEDFYSATSRHFKFQIPFSKLISCIEEHDNLIKERIKKSDINICFFHISKFRCI